MLTTVLVCLVASAFTLSVVWLVAHVLREHGPLDYRGPVVAQVAARTPRPALNIRRLVEVERPPVRRRFAVGWDEIAAATHEQGRPDRVWVGAKSGEVGIIVLRWWDGKLVEVLP